MMFSLSAEEIEVLKLSCQVAATCLAFSLIPALVVGWVLARKEFFGKSLFETFIFLPLVLKYTPARQYSVEHTYESTHN
jgi:molybdate transport system permease protein